MNAKLHFRRFEFKYLLNCRQEILIKKYLAPYISKDSFAGQTKRGSYDVVSLYYDSPRFYHYFAKFDGIKKRKKIRLRTYVNDGRFIPDIFFEIKRKDDVIISKDRFVMRADDYRQLLQTNSLAHNHSDKDKNRTKIIEEFEIEGALRAIVPKLLVVYEREPYFGKYNRGVRITFDKNLRAMENDNLYYQGPKFTDILGQNTIMELKFNGALPPYIQKVIKIFNLERVPYSKYGNGLDGCGTLSYKTFPANNPKKFNNNLIKQEEIWEIF